ncbi:efflux RND transporter periplasmic adaptor subunit [Hydrogenimonas sp.]
MKKWITAALVLLLAAGGIYLYTIQKREHERFAGYVEVRAEKGEITDQVAATGVIKPSVGAEVTIGARMSGIVVKEPVRVGDRVKQGDLIARIDDREARVSLKIAKEKLAKTMARYPREIERLEKEVEIAKLDLKSVQASLKSAKSDLDTAKWFYEQKKRLFEHKSGPQSDLKRAENDLALKKSAVQKALNGVEASALRLKKAKLALQNAKSDFLHERTIAEAEVEQAQIRLSYSVIEAPFDGIITYVSTQRGETVVAGLNAPKFVKILDPKKIENRVYIDETEIGRVEVGMEVTFDVDSYPGRKWEGRIVQIYPQPELQNSIVYYIAVVRNFPDADLLRPEMTTHDRVIIKVYKDILRVPNRAVKFRDGKFFVYLKDGGRIEERTVQTGISDSRYTQILKGIDAGDTLLMEPQKRAD